MMTVETGSVGNQQARYGANAWQFPVGLLLGAAGVMLLMVWFVISAVVAGWVSDQDPTQLGKILTYDSWLFPFAIASIGLIKVGIAIILYGIVQKLRLRVDSVKESLPALMKSQGSVS
jgi:hypothetical protein